MNIKNKLYISAGISIVLVVTLVSLVFVTSGRIAEENKKHQLLMDVYEGIAELDMVTYDYLLHREKRMEQQWNIRHNSLGEILDRLAEEEELISIRADYVVLGDLFSQITTNSEERQKYIREGASQEKIDAITGIEERLVAQLLTTSHSIITDASRFAEEAHIEVTEAQRVASNLTVILMIILAITVGSSSFLVARSISKPLTELTKSTEIIGKGDLEHKVNIQSKDELGELADAFNKMTKNLKTSRDELNKEVAERKKAEEELIKYRENLERLVEERTKELESFSYSVSHDLRAPLRAIDGFSRVLMDEQEKNLDEEGKRLLHVIRKNTQIMAQLIDDLLSFSRLGRKSMSLSQINMENLLSKVFSELRQLISEREVELKVKSLPDSTGDYAMLHQVFSNLLSNAIKFTEPQKRAIIEVGARAEENENIYSVRDNGVGFDMKYKDKLFEVFQRLHSIEDFEGTGVGLAIVKRIIDKHGGQVWAEGEVNRGATFYFTLPKNELFVD